MAVIGVVCEYNPFHRGHLLHLERSRAALGEDSPILCVMSGDFVQRGEAAVYDKFARAESACRCGADLVAELPLPWCLSSAEGFARGAVALLGGLGATHLSFGSETGDPEPLQTLARELARPETVEMIKERMKRDASLSFAAARELTLRSILGSTADILRQPNNILALEYMKAIDALGLSMTPLPLKRQGAGHDQNASEGELCSASELRQRLREGKSIAGEIPSAAAAVYARERANGRELTDPSGLEIALLSRLRALGEEGFARLPDGGDGLGRRLWRAVQEEAGLEQILDAAKSKRYTHARLRRMCLCAALGLEAGESAGTPPYLRLLAVNGRGRALLRERGGDSTLPVVTKPAALRSLGGECERVFSLGARAHDLYVLGRPDPAARKPGADWRTGPVILDEQA